MTDPPDPESLLHKQPARQRTFAIPNLVSQRLDDLCEELNRHGKVGEVRRQLLVAALITLAPETVRELEQIINSYREKKVRDALVGDAKQAEVIELRAVKPGRRPPAS